LEQQEQQATYLSVEKWNALFDEEKERIGRLKGKFEQFFKTYLKFDKKVSKIKKKIEDMGQGLAKRGGERPSRPAETSARHVPQKHLPGLSRGPSRNITSYHNIH